MKRLKVKRLFFIACAATLCALTGIFGFQAWHEPGREQASLPVADAREQIARGAYLARAGNCGACHTAAGGMPYAGGRVIHTPFGGIYASNITPDADTGIGRWNADDFWRALHNGKGKDGKLLYPAFPYPNYTRVTRADADALFAYLRTLAPVRQINRDHALRFPFNQRWLLAFWRTLYFKPGTYQERADRSPAWNRGAYLVQGLGHCSACHTSRNVLGGTAAGLDLGGGMIPMLNWYASSLTSDPVEGLGDWQEEELVDLLQTGVSRRGAVFGPMAEVVGGSLQHLATADIQAIAQYLKSVPKPATQRESASVRVSGDAKAILRQGAILYREHCSQCHKADGKGMPPAYPPLAGNRSLTVPSAINPIRMVLNGGFPPSTKGNPRPYGMPPFGIALSDEEVAAVVSYVRMSWGNQAGLVSPVEVGRFRSAPLE